MTYLFKIVFYFRNFGAGIIFHFLEFLLFRHFDRSSIHPFNSYCSSFVNTSPNTSRDSLLSSPNSYAISCVKVTHGCWIALTRIFKLIQVGDNHGHSLARFNLEGIQLSNCQISSKMSVKDNLKKEINGEAPTILDF